MREGWEYKKLGEVCESELGKTLNQSKDKGEFRPYLCAINVQWDKVDTSLLKEAKFEDNELERYSVKKGDLLVCEGGDVGRAAIWTSCEPIQYQNALHRIRFDNEIINRFCLYFLYNLKLTGELDHKYAKGVTIKHLVKSSLLSIPIPLPPLSEQEAIVAELDKINELINLKKTQLKDLDNLAQSIFYEMFGDPVENEKGWEVKKLGELSEIVRGGSPRPISQYLGGDIPWIKIGDATIGSDIYLDKTKEHIIKDGLNKTRYIPSGSLIFANCGVSLGFARIIRFDGCIHDGWLAFMDIKTDYLDKLFFLKSLTMCTSFFRNTAPDGTQPNLNTSIMKSFKQILPPLSLQQSFASRIELIEQQKAQINATIKDLETLLASRMQYWFD